LSPTVEHVVPGLPLYDPLGGDDSKEPFSSFANAQTMHHVIPAHRAKDYRSFAV
jgi:hypothetical protein